MPFGQTDVQRLTGGMGPLNHTKAHETVNRGASRWLMLRGGLEESSGLGLAWFFTGANREKGAVSVVALCATVEV